MGVSGKAAVSAKRTVFLILDRDEGLQTEEGIIREGRRINEPTWKSGELRGSSASLFAKATVLVLGTSYGPGGSVGISNMPSLMSIGWAFKSGSPPENELIMSINGSANAHSSSPECDAETVSDSFVISFPKGRDRWSQSGGKETREENDAHFARRFPSISAKLMF
jgi:hypothetical protein